MERSRGLLAGSTLVAVVATLGSLWFSLGLGLNPCELCWYQRVLMYPLVVILGVAALDGRPSAWRTALPLSTFGSAVAGYHVYLQVAPGGASCSVGGGCGAVLYPMAGGLFTIPRLSLLAFLLVTGAMVVLARNSVR